jgi:hypothetical protein
MNISKDSLFVGMKFKPSTDEKDIYGVCKALTDDKFIFTWVNYDSDYNVDSTIPLQDALACFNFYGWRILSGLEVELL